MTAVYGWAGVSRIDFSPFVMLYDAEGRDGRYDEEDHGLLITIAADG